MRKSGTGTFVHVAPESLDTGDGGSFLRAQTRKQGAAKGGHVIVVDATRDVPVLAPGNHHSPCGRNSECQLSLGSCPGMYTFPSSTRNMSICSSSTVKHGSDCPLERGVSDHWHRASVWRRAFITAVAGTDEHLAIVGT